MERESTIDKNKRRVVALSLGLFLFSIYLLSYRGGFHSVDEVSMFAVTESLVKFGRFNTNQIAWTQWTTTQAEAQGFFGQDGHVYSKKGLALALTQVPLYWLALNLPGIGMLQAVSLLNALITAATGLLIFMFLQRIDFSLFTAVFTSLIFGLTTVSTIYAKYLFSEPLAGFLLLTTAYMLFAYRQEGGLRHVVISGLAAGSAVLTRANNLFLLPVFGLYLLRLAARPIGNKTSPARYPPQHASPIPVLSEAEETHHPSRIIFHLSSLVPFAVFVLTAGGAGVILMTYNAVRSGNPLQTGYDLTLFSPNVFLGLYKLLFSPLRGLFVYSPILLLSLPGWWRLRRGHPAEAWLFFGLVGVTIGLFSAWSSGEGLSWGSRFLVPVVPFFAICLAPVVENVSSARCQVSSSKVVRITHRASRITLYVLLLISLLIQLLGIAINPWVFLARLQSEFGGEFFLEKTTALYDFRYSQIIGQIRSWSPENSDLAWWQPSGFDGLAFGLSLGLVLLCGWLLGFQVAGFKSYLSRITQYAIRNTHYNVASQRLRHLRESWREQLWGDTPQAPRPAARYASRFNSLFPLAFTTLITLAITCTLLARYYQTDRQFGPPNDAYTRALSTVVDSTDQIVTVAQYHYHIPMNRFKARVPITGFARQSWPPPKTALPLLEAATTGHNVWLITIGFPPASPDNAIERWLTFNTFKTGDDWFDDGVRLVRYTTNQPTTTRPIDTTLGQDEMRLVEVHLIESLQPGQVLPVEFVWLPLNRTRVDYNLFLQLLDANGAPLAQHDSPPNGGYTPTSTWPANKPITARHALALPSNLQAGDYRLIAGLYDPATGERLSAAGGGDFVELGNVNIKRSSVQTSKR